MLEVNITVMKDLNILHAFFIYEKFLKNPCEKIHFCLKAISTK